MYKSIVLTLGLLISVNTYAMTFEHARDIYKHILKANHIVFAPPLLLDKSLENNAYNTGFTISINQGMLNYVRNDDEMALVLGHELGHSKDGDIDNELTADSYGATVIIRAGYNKCIGAQALARLHDVGDSVHPPSTYRVKHLGC